MTLDNFESCMKVGKLGSDFITKWKAEFVERKSGNVLEAKILSLERDLLENEDKHYYIPDILFENTREEWDRLEKERDEALKKLNALGSTVKGLK